MIGYLRGRVLSRDEEGLIVDTGGVGYDLRCSLGTLQDFMLSEEIEAWVQTQMREDSLQLFGFSTQLEKRMFNNLLKVNGVGPKMALKILSAARIDDLQAMIEAGDVKTLSGLPKVGKKTAEQLILTLKGKLVAVPAEPARVRGKTVLPPRFTGSRAEVLSALVNLGFRIQEAEPVVAGLAEDIEVQNGIRQGLQVLAGA